MASNTTLALAITLPLALLCICVLIGSAIFVVRSDNQRSSLAGDLSRANAELAKVQKQVAAFPRVGPTGLESEFFREDIAAAYGEFFVAVTLHVRKWVELGSKSSQTSKDSVARVQAILFPEPPPWEPFNEGRDNSLFSSPHQYTAEEICSFIEARESRHNMFEHIVIAILLKAVTLRKDATSTLLPFDIPEVQSLAKLREATRALKLSHRVSIYIANFWIHESVPVLSESFETRSRYYKVIESFLEPYIAADADKIRYRKDLDDVMAHATEFGKKVTGRTCDHIETRWGNREDVDWIVTYPALYAVEYKREGGSVDHCLVRGAMYRATEEEIEQDFARLGVLDLI